MSAIGTLFGQSPFGLLQRHMEQVAKCVDKMGESLTAMEQGKWDQIEPLADDTSRLEHQADEIKDGIRNELMRNLLMPIDRAQILKLLSIQDDLADTAEDVSVLLTLRQLKILPDFVEEFRKFRQLNVTAFELAKAIIGDLDELMAMGFRGSESEKIRNVVHDVAFTEHQVDVLQRQLLEKVLNREERLSAADMHMWLQLLKELGRLSNLAENLADRVQMTLDLK